MSNNDTFYSSKTTLAQKVHQHLKSDIVPLDLLESIFTTKTTDARKSFVKRACQKGELIRIKNALYILPPEDQKYGINNFSIANLMLTPSYVSLESALSFYNLIPEAVYTTTSVSTAMTHELSTPLGQFSFSHLKKEYFNHGFYQEKVDGHTFVIATPLKALIDLIVLKNKQYQNIEEIVNDLRFDWNEFKSLKDFVTPEKVHELKKVYRSNRLLKMITMIEKNL